MTNIYQERTEHKLILRQHKKLTLTGFVFSVPGLLLVLYLPKSPGIFLITVCLLLLLFSIHCFYKGVSYTCITDRTAKTLEFQVKGLFGKRKQSWHFDEIQLLLMGEKDILFQSPSNCAYEILLDTVNGTRHRLLNFRSRPYCKETIALIENYLTHREAA